MAGGILQLHPWGLGNRCTEPPGTWKRFGEYGLGEVGVPGKRGARQGQSMGQERSWHGEGNPNRRITELLGSAGLATPELESHVQSN